MIKEVLNNPVLIIVLLVIILGIIITYRILKEVRIKSKTINTVTWKCRKCNKYIPTMGTYINSKKLDTVCTCDSPEYFNVVEEAEIYE